ncbi:hypothetical protein [Alicyclobacillus ferrooxydans]|uniref:Uncharacterized protein n=1 Tax=Alicyclobacillus ferrooxydans TaxID=471514 RepID=A0A0P9EVX6_9BACL|nr:hypothetical protein [Alicyclobacillus ferrooxydans]KPV43190.1 hypothetical protein AN477_13985 [Alicyclobacillus ferrooxydans]
MIQKLSEKLYFAYEPNSYNCKPILFEVTTDEGLQEVARLSNLHTGEIYFASVDEFAQAEGVERLTDDCCSGKPVGATWDAANGSVFYIGL